MKAKVLFLYNKLLHYRIPIFNILSEKYDITVAYTEGNVPDAEMNFNIVKLTGKPRWRFFWQKENLYKMACEYDVVVSYGSIYYLKYAALSLKKKRPFGLVYWSIGAAASYHRRYGEASWLYYTINNFAFKRADANIYYSEAGRKVQMAHGLKPEHLFVANNTVKVPRIKRDRERDCIMFIGTLYPQKGLPILMEAYKKAFDQNPKVLPLEIVGDGPERDNVIRMIEANGLSHKIKMHGALYTADEKSRVFSHAYACISPNQGGLGVLESMGYGVPFITHKDAITGGESFNIEHGVNGYRLDTLDNLDEVILEISANPEKYIEMGGKAYDYYWANRTPEIMANGIAEAIEHSRQVRTGGKK